VGYGGLHRILIGKLLAFTDANSIVLGNCFFTLEKGIAQLSGSMAYEIPCLIELRNL